MSCVNNCETCRVLRSIVLLLIQFFNPPHASFTVKKMNQVLELVYNNILLLGFSSDHIPQQYQQNFSFTQDSLASANRKLIEAILYFLVCKLDPKNSQKDFRACYPVLEKSQEKEFITAVLDTLAKVQSSIPGFPKSGFKRYDFDRNKIMATLWTLTNCTITHQLYKHSPFFSPGHPTDKSVLLRRILLESKRYLTTSSLQTSVTSDATSYEQELKIKIHQLKEMKIALLEKQTEIQKYIDSSPSLLALYQEYQAYLKTIQEYVDGLSSNKPFFSKVLQFDSQSEYHGLSANENLHIVLHNRLEAMKDILNSSRKLQDWNKEIQIQNHVRKEIEEFRKFENTAVSLKARLKEYINICINDTNQYKRNLPSSVNTKSTRLGFIPNRQTLRIRIQQGSYDHFFHDNLSHSESHEDLLSDSFASIHHNTLQSIQNQNNEPSCSGQDYQGLSNQPQDQISVQENKAVIYCENSPFQSPISKMDFLPKNHARSDDMKNQSIYHDKAFSSDFDFQSGRSNADSGRRAIRLSSLSNSISLSPEIHSTDNDLTQVLSRQTSSYSLEAAFRDPLCPNIEVELSHADIDKEFLENDLTPFVIKSEIVHAADKSTKIPSILKGVNSSEDFITADTSSPNQENDSLHITNFHFLSPTKYQDSTETASGTKPNLDVSSNSRYCAQSSLTENPSKADQASAYLGHHELSESPPKPDAFDASTHISVALIKPEGVPISLYDLPLPSSPERDHHNISDCPHLSNECVEDSVDEVVNTKSTFQASKFTGSLSRSPQSLLDCSEPPLSNEIRYLKREPSAANNLQILKSMSKGIQAIRIEKTINKRNQNKSVLTTISKLIEKNRRELLTNKATKERTQAREILTGNTEIVRISNRKDSNRSHDSSKQEEPMTPGIEVLRKRLFFSPKISPQDCLTAIKVEGSGSFLDEASFALFNEEGKCDQIDLRCNLTFLDEFDANLS